MHLKGLYEISEFAAEDESFSATITFDAGHAIFKGHFPGQPVVPGVCLIHIVKAIANMIAGEKVQLAKASNVKFLQLIDPRKNAEVIIEGKWLKGETGSMSISATISANENNFFKFKGSFS